MKFNIREWKLNVLFCASAILLASLTYAATNQTRQLAAGDKAKVAGPILSRDGELVRVRDKKSGEVVVVNITENTVWSTTNIASGLKLSARNWRS